jgi:LmbE family N-acetylglucosaminyl deacetylase
MNIKGVVLLLAVAASGLTPADAQERWQVATDSTSYNAGSEVRLKIQTSGAQPAQLYAAIRFAGSARPLVKGILVSANGPGYFPFWEVPAEPLTGRYEVDLSGAGVSIPGVASFVVYKKVLRVTRIEFDHGSYADGEEMHCTVTLRNYSNRLLDNLRIEIAPQYYPWIEPMADEVVPPPVIMNSSFSVSAATERSLASSAPVAGPPGDGPQAVAYTVMVWDRARAHLYDLAFSEPISVYPAHENNAGKAYPHVFLYPRLELLRKQAVAYREFYPPDYVSSYIRFDVSHTSFAAGKSPVIGFEIRNPLARPCTGCTALTRVWKKDGELLLSARAALPDDGQGDWKQNRVLKPLREGLYIYEVQLLCPHGAVLASNRLEFSVNRLPKSILFFGAHEDDDTAFPAIIRAAVENHIPIHFVFLTGGDAGGCERYYARSCDAERAVQFGETRMEEARQSLTHLGVTVDAISFLGLPDGGLEEIWKTGGDQLYAAPLLASDHSPYGGVAVPNLAFSRHAVLETMEKLIRDFQPEAVLTAHPDERHADHRSDCWFVIKALQELVRDKSISPNTELLVDQSYGPVAENRAPYRYERQVLHVPGEVALLGQEAQWFYQSQDGNRLQGELKPFDKLPREEIYWKVMDWQEHEGWNENPNH